IAASFATDSILIPNSKSRYLERSCAAPREEQIATHKTENAIVRKLITRSSFFYWRSLSGLHSQLIILTGGYANLLASPSADRQRLRSFCNHTIECKKICVP